MPSSLPALVAGILRSDMLWRIQSDSARLEAADLAPAYFLDGGLSVQTQAERAAQLAAELARKLQRLPEAFAWWPVFDAGAYFDLHAVQAGRVCRVEELSEVVRVRVYGDLLLPAFRQAERYFVEAFLPAYHVAAGRAADDIFVQSLQADALPQMAALLADAEQAIGGALAVLEDQLDVLGLLGGLEERIQHRPPPGARMAPGLPPALQRLPREMPTLTLDLLFPTPEQRPTGREAWIRFQQTQAMR